MRITTIVGARPQFIKIGAVARAMAAVSPAIDHVLVHTGQHYDDNMSQVFFDQLELPRPDVNLGVSGGNHGEMTAGMLAGIERVLLERRPDWLLVYGDTNSTLAGALAAAKLNIPVAHVEAGLRSYNRKMPEEVNRVLTDHVSLALFCPTQTSVDNLAKEGIAQGVHLVGDVMFDAALRYGRAEKATDVLRSLGLTARGYYLATCHRAENTDDPTRLKSIFDALAHTSRERPVVLPLHPRTRKLLQQHAVPIAPSVHVLEPLGYLEMVALERNAEAILTDSGGVQKEAYFFGVPCITLRTETEWVETVEAGWNTIADADEKRILAAVSEIAAVRERPRPECYGRGDAASQIVALLARGAI